MFLTTIGKPAAASILILSLGLGMAGLNGIVQAAGQLDIAASGLPESGEVRAGERPGLSQGEARLDERKKGNGEPAPAAPGVPAPRTVRGIVRDPEGRPVAGAWIGEKCVSNTFWQPIVEGGIRERTEPFRDNKGQIVPPGVLGKYFEWRDDEGAWRPVHPDDIRRNGVKFPGDRRSLGAAELGKTLSPFEIRPLAEEWRMEALAFQGGFAGPRSGPDGRFEFLLPLHDVKGYQRTIHLASADFTLQAIRTVAATDPDAPIEVTLRPTRWVRGIAVMPPECVTREHLKLTILGAGTSADSRERQWDENSLPYPLPSNKEPLPKRRRFEFRLPQGRYTARFNSSKFILQNVDFEVPPGEGLLELPTIELESRAYARMIGGPAAEIEASDLEGRPVRLADFRGKVVVLDFWAHWCGPCMAAMPELGRIRDRFKGRHLEMLALHDASVASAAEYRKVLAPRLQEFLGGGDVPLRVLLDRPEGTGTGEKGSGRTAARYEVFRLPATFVIGADGTLLEMVEDVKTLEKTLERLLPGTQPAVQIGSESGGRDAVGRAGRNAQRTILASATRGYETGGMVVNGPADEPTTWKGRVTSPGGMPIARARLVTRGAKLRGAMEARTDDAGEFTLDVEKADFRFGVVVTAPDLAPAHFTIDPDDAARRLDWKLGVGATVTGRLVRDGKPVAGVAVGLIQAHNDYTSWVGTLQTSTDAEGRFRLTKAVADEELWAFARAEDLKGLGAVSPRLIRTGGHGEEVALGDLEVKPGMRLAGRVVLPDDKPIPAGVTVSVGGENTNDGVRTKLDDQGRFAVDDLPEGPIVVRVLGLSPGYRLSPENACRNPGNPGALHGQLDRDVTDLRILFEAGREGASQPAPGDLEQFARAHAGTITGAPAGGAK